MFLTEQIKSPKLPAIPLAKHGPICFVVSDQSRERFSLSAVLLKKINNVMVNY